MNELPQRVPTVADIETFSVRGPWPTKSGGALDVLCAFPIGEVQQYFTYDDAELARVPSDLRGLRLYHVRDLPEGRVGGTEFHRVRVEIVIGLTGAERWECEDLHGDIRHFELTPETGARVPPFLLHTYRVRAPGSGHLVITNTLFDPDDPRTHDTYSLATFRELQAARR
ncbi:MAG: hypothetical protein Q8R16_05320 [bacterium]|nr:hypothetical protein [bacterium]